MSDKICFRRDKLFTPGTGCKGQARRDLLCREMSDSPGFNVQLNGVLSRLLPDHDFFVEQTDGLAQLPSSVAQQVLALMSESGPRGKRLESVGQTWFNDLLLRSRDISLRVGGHPTGIVYWGDYQNPKAQLLIPFLYEAKDRFQIKNPFVVAGKN